MAPLVVSVHSIVGLDFAGAATVGWHSTEFPPFFVFGALLSGFAMVLLLVDPAAPAAPCSRTSSPGGTSTCCAG